MDDLIASVPTIEQAIEIRRQLTEIGDKTSFQHSYVDFEPT